MCSALLWIVQAVASIVGCAELISTVLAGLAVLCYFRAVDGPSAAAQPHMLSTTGSTRAHPKGAGTSSSDTVQPRQQSSRQPKPQRASAPSGPKVAAHTVSVTSEPALTVTVQHWLLVFAAATLALAAALSKEIGITAIGTMLAYDILLAPHVRPTALPQHETGAGGPVPQARVTPAACARQWLRMGLAAATALAYVKMRQWVAVQHLLTSFEKVRGVVVDWGRPNVGLLACRIDRDVDSDRPWALSPWCCIRNSTNQTV